MDQTGRPVTSVARRNGRARPPRRSRRTFSDPRRPRCIAGARRPRHIAFAQRTRGKPPCEGRNKVYRAAGLRYVHSRQSPTPCRRGRQRGIVEQRLAVDGPPTGPGRCGARARANARRHGRCNRQGRVPTRWSWSLRGQRPRPSAMSRPLRGNAACRARCHVPCHRKLAGPLRPATEGGRSPTRGVRAA